jgi:hypothetical protein
MATNTYSVDDYNFKYGLGNYTLNPMEDPRYAAVIAGLTEQENVAKRGTERTKAQADADFAYQQERLDMEKPGAQRRLDASMLSRGVFRSGEADRRRGDLSADFLDRLERARYAATQTRSGADANLETSLADLAVRRAAETGDATTRVRSRQEELRQQASAEEAARSRIAEQAAMPTGGGGGGGGGTSGGGGGYDSPDAYAQAALAYQRATTPAPTTTYQAPAPTPMPTRPRAPAPTRPRLSPTTPLRPITGAY